MPAHSSADVVVIGLGPGGEEVAGKLAQAGLEVVGVEAELVGGECPYWGCVPSKMAIRGASVLAEGRRIGRIAGSASVSPDWAPIAHRIRSEATDDWNDKVAVDRLVGHGGRFVRGRGRLAGPRRVLVDGPAGADEIEVRRGVVIATGARPVIPPIEGLAGTPFWTNRDVMRMTQLPASLVVLGGGAIGVEMAQAIARFGRTEVTVVEGLERLLALEEPEVSEIVTAALEADGITVRTGVAAARVAHGTEAFTLTLGDGTSLTAERLLISTGRRPALADLGLDSVGLDPLARALSVDGHMRAGDGLWAVGDVTGAGAFTHMAMYQAGICIADVLGRDEPAADYRAVARVTFTDPEVGSVGLSEAAARKAGLPVATGSAAVSSSARGWIHGPGNEGVIKLVADTERSVLVGATSCGPWGGEVLSMLTLAVHAEVPLAVLERMIYAYPTFHRGVQDALRDLRG